MLLRGKDIPITNLLSIHIPTLDEIYKIDSDYYFATVANFCSTPSDHKVELDDIGIDYSQIEEFEFFAMQYRVFDNPKSKKILQLLFGDFDFSSLLPKTNANDELVLAGANGEIFDKAVYMQTVSLLRERHNFARHCDKPGNEHTRKYLIDKERRQRMYQNKKPKNRDFENNILALVNTTESKYDFNTVWNLNIYQFNKSIAQIQKVKTYGFIMQGIYSGFMSSKDISLESIHWLNDK